MTAGGAFHTRRCHTAIIDRQATAIIPIRMNRRLWKEKPGRTCLKRNPARRPALRRGILEALDPAHARNGIEARLAASEPSENASLQGTLTARPPKS